MEDSFFVEIRGLLGEEKSQGTWDKICRFLKKHDDHKDFELGFEYLKNHLREWEPSLKFFEVRNLSKKPHPIWPLVTSVRFSRYNMKTLPKTFAKRLGLCNEVHHLDFSWNSNLDGIEELFSSIDASSLTSLNLEGCHAQKSYEFINGLSALENLILESWHKEMDLSSLKSLSSLSINDASSLSTFSVFEKNEQLQSLSLYNLVNTNEHQPLPTLRLLEDVRVGGLSGFTDFSFLGEQPHLRTLGVRGLHGTIDFSSLCEFSSLEELSLMYADMVSDETSWFLPSLRRLKGLSLYEPNLTFLRHFPNLEYLELDISDRIHGDFLLAELKSLRELHISFMLFEPLHEEEPGIVSFQFLEGCSSLEKITLGYECELTDISILKTLPNLSVLTVFCELSMERWKEVAGIESLKELILERYVLGDGEQISLFQRLEKLTIVPNSVTDVSFLLELPNLSYLSLSADCPNLEVEPKEQSRELKTREEVEEYKRQIRTFYRS